MRRRIYLARHGHVSYVDEEGYRADPDTVALTERGRREAKALGALLEGVRLDRAIATSLPRTQETARLALRGRGPAIEVVSGLREIQPGDLSAVDDLERALKEALLIAGDPGARFLGGDRYDAFCAGIAATWRAIEAAGGFERILVVAHGVVNRALLVHWLGLPLSHLACFEQGPGCLNVIDLPDGPYDRGRGYLRALNLTPGDLAKAGVRGTTMEQLWGQYSGEE